MDMAISNMSQAMADEANLGVTIAIIMPVYGHPVLFSEAVSSALRQTDCPTFALIIVSDGCKQVETDVIASAFAMSDQRITYLRKANGGPSSARNYGIEYALDQFSELEAVFFLDSDNRIAPTALSDAYRQLKSSDGGGWVYTDINSFGIQFTGNYGGEYSPLLHIIYDNICDTGSLVSLDVLQAGVRFDEDSRSGYEDWDFWLQCLKKGYRGQHTSYGLAYRQRPESRFRDVNRQREVMLEHLRQRHKDLVKVDNLVRMEHETNPAVLMSIVDTVEALLFSDATMQDMSIPQSRIIDDFYQAVTQPDEHNMPSYYGWARQTTLDLLAKNHVLQSLIFLLRREAVHADFAVITFANNDQEIGIRILPPQESGALRDKAQVWMCTSQALERIAKASVPLGSLNGIEIELRCPLHSHVSDSIADKIDDFVEQLRSSPFNAEGVRSWNWKPVHFPDRRGHHSLLCKFFEVPILLTQAKKNRIEIALLLPIASYGGAEKVAYAMARYLRAIDGVGVHAFIVGPPQMKILSEYEGIFNSIHFLANDKFPMWGGAVTNFGQEIFMPGASEIESSGLRGLLLNFDMVVNCHSAPANSVIGALKSHGIKTASYLHVFDSTPRQRLVGHPYLALGFEHAYDLILTCSENLKDAMHGLGVPEGKLMAIRNAASFSIQEDVTKRTLAHRRTPRRNRRLRCLYIGRLDRQKGVERLYGVASKLSQRGIDIEWRIVGSGLLDGGINWVERFRDLGINVEPPVYASGQLADIYAWGDVLILPSRWEGAPLVIPEAQLLGCIPVATDVGAVSELLSDSEDGFLVSDDASDDEVAESIVTVLTSLNKDDVLRRKIALNASDVSRRNNWDANFAPLGKWITEQFG